MSPNLVVRLTRVGSSVHWWVASIAAKCNLFGDKEFIREERTDVSDPVVRKVIWKNWILT
ncbi:uncharacterized protein METZ01_LOCUS444858, partial [marine metagenome]